MICIRKKNEVLHSRVVARTTLSSSMHTNIIAPTTSQQLCYQLVCIVELSSQQYYYSSISSTRTTRMHTVLLLEQSSIRRILHKVLASSIRALVRVVVSTVCIFVTVSYAYYCNTLQYELRDEFFRNVETPLSVVEIFIAFVTQLVAEHRDTLDKPPPQPSLVGISVRFAHHVRHYRGVRRRNSQ